MLRLHGPSESCNLICKVDRERSTLKGFITDNETGKIFWALEIPSHPPEDYVESQGPILSIDCMEFAVRDWRHLEGKEGFFCLDDIATRTTTVERTSIWLAATTMWIRTASGS